VREHLRLSHRGIRGSGRLVWAAMTASRGEVAIQCSRSPSGRCTTTRASASDATKSRPASDSGIRTAPGTAAPRPGILSAAARWLNPQGSRHSHPLPSPNRQCQDGERQHGQQNEQHVGHFRPLIPVHTPAIRHPCPEAAKPPSRVSYAEWSDSHGISTPEAASVVVAAALAGGCGRGFMSWRVPRARSGEQPCP
jgi:hypothetical protein